MAGDLDRWADAVLKRQRENAGKVLFAMATVLQAEAKKDLSVPNPAPHANPSKPGEWPRARTFNLRDAVTIDRSLQETIATGEVRVGVLKSAHYLVPLVQRMGRRGLLDSYQKARAKLARVRKFLGG